MKAMGAERIAGMVACVAALLAVIGVLSFAGPCVHDDGGHGTCYGASLLIVGAGMLAAVCALVALFMRSGKTAGIAAVLAAAFGVVVVAAPGGIMPLCMMETMRCWTIMRPFALLCGAVVIVAAIGQAILAFRRR